MAGSTRPGPLDGRPKVVELQLYERLGDGHVRVRPLGARGRSVLLAGAMLDLSALAAAKARIAELERELGRARRSSEIAAQREAPGPVRPAAPAVPAPTTAPGAAMIRSRFSGT